MQEVIIGNGTYPLARIHTSDDELTRQVTVERDGESVLGIDIGEDGTIKVGDWPDGETWRTLHTIPPKEN